MISLEALWKEHCADKFPRGLGGEEIDGVDLVLLDSDVAGCISGAIGSCGRIEDDKAAILRECLTELDVVIRKLDGDNKRYFQRLRSMTELVLKPGRP